VPWLFCRFSSISTKRSRDRDKPHSSRVSNPSVLNYYNMESSGSDLAFAEAACRRVFCNKDSDILRGRGAGSSEKRALLIISRKFYIFIYLLLVVSIKYLHLMVTWT